MEITRMPANLTRDWIQYLKNNQIAALKSDPTSGKINYKRPVTTSDVVHFLQVKTTFGDAQINAAIDRVVGAHAGKNTSPSNVLSMQPPSGNGRHNSNTRPQHTPEPSGNTSSSKKYDTSNATDVEPRFGPRLALPSGRTGPPLPAETPPDKEPPANVRTGGKVKGQVSQTPNAIRKRQARANRKAALNEDFKDDPGEQLSEKEIEEIFKLLSKGAPTSAEKNQDAADKTQNGKVDPQEVRKDELEKIKKLIFKTMTAEQRKQLWDELKGAKLTEAIIKKYEAEEIFKDIVNNSQFRYRQSNITMDQLKDAWQQAGYPLDTDEISEMLMGMGYDSASVNRVINSVTGEDNEDNEDGSNDDNRSSAAVTKISAYIHKAGLTEEIMQFMQENFAEELKPKQSMWQKAKGFANNLFGKTTNEGVKKIFTLMLSENIDIIKRVEHARIGRNKK